MRFVLGLCLASILASCASVSISKLDTSLKYPPVNPKDVFVYKSDRLPWAYKKIALLTASGSADLTNEDFLIELMKKKAGEIGANGIVILTVPNYYKTDSVNLENDDSINKLNVTIIGADKQRRSQAMAIWIDFSHGLITTW
jgi:hypothetical protein